MKPESQESYQRLEKTLDELIKVYRHILQVVRLERDILISANLNELHENNKTKEVSFLKSRQLEDDRQKAARDLAASEHLPESTKLLEFSRHLGGTEGERLRSRHSVLELLLKRVREHNQHNEMLVKSALDNVTGAIGSIRDQLRDKPTYKKSGGVTSRPAESGQLVSKEV
jgi:flagellar biosynthesis/type III secretory pathway chaperone